MKNKLRKQKKPDLVSLAGLNISSQSVQHLTALLQNWMRRCLLAEAQLQKLREQHAKLQNQLYRQSTALKGVSLQNQNYKNSLKKNNSLLLQLSRDVASKAKNTHRYNTSPSNIFQIPSRFTKNYESLFSEENVRKQKKMRRCNSRRSIFINTKHLNGFIPFPKNLLESDFQVQFSELYRLNDNFKVVDSINFSYQTALAINWLKTLPVLLVKTINLQFKLCQLLSKFEEQKTSQSDFYEVFQTFLQENIQVQKVVIYVVDEAARSLKSRAKNNSMVTIVPYGLGNPGKAAQTGRTVFYKSESSEVEDLSTLSVPIFTQNNNLKVVINLTNKLDDSNEFTDYDQFYVRLLGSSVIELISQFGRDSSSTNKHFQQVVEIVEQCGSAFSRIELLITAQRQIAQKFSFNQIRIVMFDGGDCVFVDQEENTLKYTLEGGVVCRTKSTQKSFAVKSLSNQPDYNSLVDIQTGLSCCVCPIKFSGQVKGAFQFVSYSGISKTGVREFHLNLKLQSALLALGSCLYGLWVRLPREKNLERSRGSIKDLGSSLRYMQSRQFIQFNV